MVDQVAGQINSAIQGLMTPPQQNNTLANGALVTFQYKFFKVDPYPLVILSKVEPGKTIKGVNLHYLTYNSVKAVLQANAGNTAFSWHHHIKSQNDLVDAFRCYKWPGIALQTFRILDAQLIVKVANMVRSIDPNEIRAMKQSIREQIQQQMNVTADQMTGQQVQPQTPQISQAPVIQAVPQVQQVTNQGQNVGMSP